VVVAADSRSQYRNKEKAFERLARRLMTLNRVPARRIPTKRTRAAKERALGEKKRRQQIKNERKRISAEDS
jgi:ribosome-associated protein